VAAAGAAEEDRELDADQLAAKVGEGRGQAGQSCPVLSKYQYFRYSQIERTDHE
jgi:hypothetical protein